MRWILLVWVLLLSGCATKTYYLPSTPAPKIHHKITCSVGVSDVQLPEYVLVGKLLFKEGNRVGYVEDFAFGEDIERFFTKATIDYLRQALQDPEVMCYPWEVERRPKLVVRIVVEEFYLDRKEDTLLLRGHLQIDEKSIPFAVHQSVEGSITQAIDRLIAKYLQKVATAVGKSCR